MQEETKDSSRLPDSPLKSDFVGELNTDSYIQVLRNPGFQVGELCSACF